jgi:hypothetical protein
MPNITITIPSLGDYDAAKAGERAAADALLRSWGDKSCNVGLGPP